MRERLKARWGKSALKAWAEGRLPLGRGKKLAVNLAVIALAGLWLWGLAGYPLPAVELQFRRLERACLEERSELVFRSRGVGQRFQVEEDTWVYLDRPAAVGLLEGRALVGMAARTENFLRLDDLYCYPLEKGVTLVPLPGCQLLRETYEPGFTLVSGGQGLLLANVPPEAAEGELELVAACRGTDYRRDCPLFDLGDGAWLAQVEPPESGYSSGWYVGGSYTLRLYDAQGALLLEQSGTVPRPL